MRHMANIYGTQSLPGVKDPDNLKDNQFKHCARQSKCNAENQQYDPVMNLRAEHTT